MKTIKRIFYSNIKILQKSYPNILEWFLQALNNPKFQFIVNKNQNCLIIYNTNKNKISNISILPSQNKSETIREHLNNFFLTHNNTTITVDSSNTKMLLFLRRYRFEPYKTKQYNNKTEIYLIYRRK